MLPPLPRCSSWVYSSLILPSHVSLPRKGHRVGLHIVLFEACSAFTRVAACTLARSPIRDPATRRLQTFRRLHACSGCFRLERLPGGACTHWKAPPCHGAHPFRTLVESVSFLSSYLLPAILTNTQVASGERHRCQWARTRLNGPQDRCAQHPPKPAGSSHWKMRSSCVFSAPRAAFSRQHEGCPRERVRELGRALRVEHR